MTTFSVSAVSTKADHSSVFAHSRLRKDYNFGSSPINRLSCDPDQKALGANGDMGKDAGTVGGLRIGESRPGQVAQMPEVLKATKPVGGGAETNA